MIKTKFTVFTEDYMTDICQTEIHSGMYNILDKYYKDKNRPLVTNASIEVTVGVDKEHQILEYCKDHTDKMWAASIVSIMLDCDFRDAKETLDNYFKNYKG